MGHYCLFPSGQKISGKLHYPVDVGLKSTRLSNLVKGSRVSVFAVSVLNFSSDTKTYHGTDVMYWFSRKDLPNSNAHSWGHLASHWSSFSERCRLWGVPERDPEGEGPGLVGVDTFLVRHEIP